MSSTLCSIARAVLDLLTSRLYCWFFHFNWYNCAVLILSPFTLLHPTFSTTWRFNEIDDERFFTLSCWDTESVVTFPQFSWFCRFLTIYSSVFNYEGVKTLRPGLYNHDYSYIHLQLEHYSNRILFLLMIAIASLYFRYITEAATDFPISYVFDCCT